MKNKKLVAVQIILILLLIFVWGNSLLSGKESGEISEGVTALVARWFGIASADLGHIVRKLAHFSEFAALGATVTLLLTYKGQRGAMFVMPFAIGMMSFPLIDETIQIFTPDRGPSITDVWIDMSGYLLGAFVIFAMHKLIVHCKQKRADKKKRRTS